MIQRKAAAVWQGNLKEGRGFLTTESKLLNQVPYTFAARFEKGVETNPEELLAAAHAGCFAMALSAELGKVGITAKSLEAQATVSLEQTAQGFKIAKSHLDLTAEIPGVDRDLFDQAVNNAKTGCPVSKLFNAEITISVMLKDS